MKYKLFVEKVCFFIISLFAGLFFLISSAQADSLTYDNAGGDGDWENISNWQTGILPDLLDDAFITDSVLCTSAEGGFAYSANVSNSAGFSSGNCSASLTVATSVTFNDSSYSPIQKFCNVL